MGLLKSQKVALGSVTVVDRFVTRYVSTNPKFEETTFHPHSLVEKAYNLDSSHSIPTPSFLTTASSIEYISSKCRWASPIRLAVVS